VPPHAIYTHAICILPPHAIHKHAIYIAPPHAIYTYAFPPTDGASVHFDGSARAGRPQGAAASSEAAGCARPAARTPPVMPRRADRRVSAGPPSLAASPAASDPGLYPAGAGGGGGGGGDREGAERSGNAAAAAGSPAWRMHMVRAVVPARCL
jgi:hypothetical protein